ncbi:hypothetical protein LJC49_05505 [Ruminococcaceae bacterium OttesenSCG-928-I18]|nr:hypothetical protein [Ruminococcaceae bacterium OttesenSCG-928-I18]
MHPAINPPGEKAKRSQPLTEYPRPQMVRDSYLNLNGLWEYAVTTKEGMPSSWHGEIMVPFAPESQLSGMGRILQPNETLWYRRTVVFPLTFIKERTYLHFGAVDQCCVVFWNGIEVGRHDGGYLPFSCDVTEAAFFPGTNELLVSVIDETDQAPYMRGRQSLLPREGWRSPMSGLWQTVWMESVPQSHLTSLKITPHYDEPAVELSLSCEGDAESGEISLFALATCVAKRRFTPGETLHIQMPGAISWHPRNPFLYDVEIQYGEDLVKSYFGMRKFSLAPNEKGKTVFHLNNRPFFVRGLLDEGFYSSSLYTPPGEQAILDDLNYAKSSGFNMVRKFGKIEPLRWYHHCDRLGLLVWQDLPGGGEDAREGPLSKWRGGKMKDDAYRRFGRQNAEGRVTFLRDADRICDHLHSAPCLCCYTLFEEGYGQFDAAALSSHFKQRDPSRLVDHASGRYDQGAGDFLSLHLFGETLPPDVQMDARALALSGCGGFSLPVKGPFLPSLSLLPAEGVSLEDALHNLWQNVLLPLQKQGLSVFCYYRLSDADGETSGLLTSDRLVQKISADYLQKCNALLEEW